MKIYYIEGQWTVLLALEAILPISHVKGWNSRVRREEYGFVKSGALMYCIQDIPLFWLQVPVQTDNLYP